MTITQFIRDHLLLSEVLIVVSLFCTYFFTETKIHPVKRAINGLLLVLIFGIPIFFTSITRSVFEVNKMLLLRFTTILILGLWAWKSLWIDYDSKEIDPFYVGKPYYSFYGIKWYKTGLEVPMLIWALINILSTIFSRNIYVSIIGAYDRWEGIATVLNYVFLVLIFAKLVDSIRLFYWIFFSFIVSASMSALYGIFQMNGIDFMQWSSDATARAFGSINNPVHYGPYVGMMILLVFGYMIQVKFFQDKVKSWQFHSLYFLSFILTSIVYYAMFASWGRGTWLGFQGALTFFLLFVCRLFMDKSKKHYFLDFFASVGVVGLVYIMFLFNLIQVKPIITVPFLLLVFGLYSAWVYKEKGLLNLIERVFIVVLAYVIQLISTNELMFVVYIVIIGLLYWVHEKMFSTESIFVKNKMIIVTLLGFGFIPLSPSTVDFLMFLFFVALIYVFFLVYRSVKDRSLVVIGGGLIICLFAAFFIPQHAIVKKFLSGSSTEKSLNVLNVAKGKTEGYKTAAVGGNPRMSMWKSGIAWGFKNPLLGTGPDTIKEMYPYYRRVEYAKLEGGYNLTPDRLHNEYVNTFATTGFLGLIGRYVLVIGTYLILMLGYLYDNRQKPSFSLLLGALAGFIFYQGQVLFNFGVVATTSLNYMLMGLGLAIGYYGLGNQFGGKIEESGQKSERKKDNTR